MFSTLKLEDNKRIRGDNCEASSNYPLCDVVVVSMDISLITYVVYIYLLNGKMNKHRQEEEEKSEHLKFRSRPVTAGGIQNGVRFFMTAMNALDRIEGVMSEIEQTKTLVHQMMGEFSLAGGRIRISPEGQTKKVRSKKKELKDKDVIAASRCQKRSKPKRNKTLLEICEEWQKKNPRFMDNK